MMWTGPFFRTQWASLLAAPAQERADIGHETRQVAGAHDAGLLSYREVSLAIFTMSVSNENSRRGEGLGVHVTSSFGRVAVRAVLEREIEESF